MTKSLGRPGDKATLVKKLECQYSDLALTKLDMDAVG